MTRLKEIERQLYKETIEILKEFGKLAEGELEVLLERAREFARGIETKFDTNFGVNPNSSSFYCIEPRPEVIPVEGYITGYNIQDYFGQREALSQNGSYKRKSFYKE